MEINKIYNRDCADLMRDMIRGGAESRLDNY